MRFLQQFFITTAFYFVYGAVTNSLAKCPGDVSEKYITKQEAQVTLCQAAMNVTSDVLLSEPSLFCTKDECTQLVTDAASWTCKPNTMKLIPTNYCNQVCQALVLKMEERKWNCDKVKYGNFLFCPLCTEFSNAAKEFVDSCGLWTSADSLVVSIANSTTKCNGYKTPGTPTRMASSSSTTYIVVGVVGGVLVVGVVAFLILRKKRGEADSRSGSHLDMTHSPRSGTYSGGPSTSNQFAPK
ncbi:unnamed protein product [Aphanomyces euteiches]